MELNLTQQKLEMAKLDVFYRKLWTSLKHLQNTKDLGSKV